MSTKEALDALKAPELTKVYVKRHECEWIVVTQTPAEVLRLVNEAQDTETPMIALEQWRGGQTFPFCTRFDNIAGAEPWV